MIAAVSSQHRKRVWWTSGCLLAAAGIFGATALIESPGAVKLHLQTGKGSKQSSLNGGQLVAAADLVSDPVFVTSTVGFALATTEKADVAVERLARSNDAGHTWHVTGSQFPVAGTFTTLQFASASDGYIFGPAGLLVTTNGGGSWEEVQGLNGTLQRAVPVPGSNGQLNVWATYTSCPASPVQVNCRVGLAVSIDSGRHWHDVNPPGLNESSAGGDILARWTVDAAYVLSYGPSGGGLAYTADDGRSWTHLTDPCAGSFAREDLAAPPPLHGHESALWLICGATVSAEQPKLVYRSFDGGHSWVLMAATGFGPAGIGPVGEIPLSGEVSQLATINSTQAWLGVRGLGLIVTFDSGKTWQLADGIPTSEPDTEVGVTFNSSTLGWVIVFRRGVWRTEDALHWTLMDS
jgi:hypothetical protein